MKRRSWWIGLLCVGGITGCSGASLEPVPTTATGDFVCDGVAREGVELILGGRVASVEPSNTWDDESFLCFVGGEKARVSVSATPTMFATWGGGTDEGVLERASEWMGAVPFEAEGAVGAGSRDPDGALWVCGGRLLRVDLSGRLVEGRDASLDAANLLVSMLPWACGDEEPPPATVETK